MIYGNERRYIFRKNLMPFSQELLDRLAGEQWSLSLNRLCANSILTDEDSPSFRDVHDCQHASLNISWTCLVVLSYL